MIMIRPPVGFFTGEFGTEIIYSVIIIICSLMIYFGTKELYELSSHKGIHYFRWAFLFFAVAYFFRSIIKFLLLFFELRAVLDISPRAIGTLSMFVFMYFSAMAIFYLLYSVMWKKWNGKSKKIYLFHALALILSLASILFRGNSIYLGLNFFLFVFVAFIVYFAYKESKKRRKGPNLYVVYMLLFVFWILNIIDILIPMFFSMFKLVIYLASLGIFLLILYKVIKKTG